MMYTNMDASKLQLIFPEEIWLLCAERIQDTRNYQRLCDSSPYLCTLLLGLRVYKLFPEVAKVFCSQIRRKPVMKRQVITKFRSVCRTWEKWTNAALHNLPYKLLPEETIDPDIGPGPDNLLFTKEYFRSNEQIESFRQRFDASHASTNKNPFLCRQVNLHCSFVLNGLIEQFLRAYGQHIWHCSLTGFFWNIRQNAIPQLNGMLKLMPNLQALSLSGRTFSADTCKQLELYVSAHPFPKLEHLRYLKLFRVPPPIFDGLLKANRHIGICNVKQEFVQDYENEPALLTEDFLRLNQLSIELNETVLLRQLQNRGLAWPLRTLFFNLTRDVSCNDFIQFLGNKSPATLNELTLDLHMWESAQLLELVPLQLPNLEVFSVKTVFPTPLDFLLPTRNSLKRLSVEVYDPFETISFSRFKAKLLLALRVEKTVKFLEFRNNLIESNIWSIFSQLRSVEYYDREMGFFAKPERPPIRRFDLMIKKLADIH